MGKITLKTEKIRLPRWALFVLSLLLAVAAGGCFAYYWRVFYYLDARGVSGIAVTAGVCGLAALTILAGWGLSCVRRFWLRAGVCVFLCGALFALANPPLQTPDETQHFLRAYAISMGRLDFDASRGYPEDVSRLVEAFPGAWVNSHTSNGMAKDPDTGEDEAYDTAGFALKQYGESGRVESIADSFSAYLSGTAAKAEAKEPILFMILPFLPQALGMALARLLGFGALGALYGGRLANLLVYSALCALALHKKQSGRAVFLAVMLLPLSLYMGASLSYDAALLGCYYLMISLALAERWQGRDAALFAAAFLWVNMVKPWINLLWLAMVFLPGKGWQVTAKGRRLPRWVYLAALIAAALSINCFVDWYGVAFRSGYGVIGRQLDNVDQLPQLRFILSNPLRFAAVLLGTLYENDFFLGQLGVFGSLDLPVNFLNLTGVATLTVGSALSVEKKPRLGRVQGSAVALWSLVYLAGAMTAMYITWTPVGMIRVIGLQSRYFLPLYLLLFWLAGQGMSAVLRPRESASAEITERSALFAFAAYGVLGALLLFQHYFIGPIYTIG